MSDRDIDVIVGLRQEDFDHREWVAMRWMRDYFLFEGDIPDRELVSEFERIYSPKERTKIFAVGKWILFANTLNNTIMEEVYEEGAACNIQ